MKRSFLAFGYAALESRHRFNLVQIMDGSKHVEAFDTRRYLLDRYGLRMTKRQVGFEAHKCRATLDNMRNIEHDSYCASLARAEIERGRRASSGAFVLFSTPAIADWLDGNS